MVGCAYQELPAFLLRKKALFKVHNKDNGCFGNAGITAMVPPTDHLYGQINCNHLFHQFAIDDIASLLAIEDIPAIKEKRGVKINVFSFYDDLGRDRFPLYVSEKGHEKMIDLLFWDDHYPWIKNILRFMADLSRNHRTLWCRSYMGHFDSADVLKTGRRTLFQSKDIEDNSSLLFQKLVCHFPE